MTSLLFLGTLLPGVLLIGTGYITCKNPYVAVVILALAIGFSGLQYPGVMVNHVDNAPPFAGVLFGISNTFATLPGILAPYAIGKITTHVSINKVINCLLAKKNQILDQADGHSFLLTNMRDM